MLFDDSAVTWKWKWRKRNWKREEEEWIVEGAEVLIDPLSTRRLRMHTRLQGTQAATRKNEPTPDFIDPLGEGCFTISKGKSVDGGATRAEQLEPTIACIDPIAVRTEKCEPTLTNTLATHQDDLLTKETVLL
ncbi:unnamed protein product [Toxocara canis]|uniref:Integrase core domain containing protein n=1 Tax=Toxocara canis TaxID=6265 RepID=A0A183UNV0_TOXCA|nr:unnamed protein product [Toxocara canis]